MLKSFFNIRAAEKAPFPDSVLDVAYGAALLLGNSEDQTLHNAVLIGPRTALAAAHNLLSSHLPAIDVHHPATGAMTRIAHAQAFLPADLAVLQLADELPGPYAPVAAPAQIAPQMPVLMARPLKSGDKFLPPADLRAAFQQQRESGISVKGMLVQPETEYFIGNQFVRTDCAKFHMRTEESDAGAGLFNQNGQLVSLDIGGYNRMTIGVRTEPMRRAAFEHTFGK